MSTPFGKAEVRDRTQAAVLAIQKDWWRQNCWQPAPANPTGTRRYPAVTPVCRVACLASPSLVQSSWIKFLADDGYGNYTEPFTSLKFGGGNRALQGEEESQWQM